MKYQVEISIPANEDLNNIYRYIFNDLKEPIVASNIIKRIEKTILSLDEMPNRFKAYEKEPWRSRNMRSVAVGNYIVFYTVNDVKKEVLVIRILYGGMDTESKINTM